MNPTVSERTMSTLLLTAPLLPRGSGSNVKPLSPREYSGIVSALNQCGRSLEDLLGPHIDEMLGDVRIRIESERLSALLSRGMQLASAVDRWRERGIWVIGQGDSQYPLEVADRLGEAAPPVLYGCGEVALLRVAGLAIVGSRDASETAIEFVRSVAEKAVYSEVPVVSGGARGVDASAMRSALQAGGTVVGVLAQHLARAAIAGENREHLMAGRLLLISPYDPAARFNVGNAMARNKLIYAFANAALVASAEHGRGGTWAGAVEQLEGGSHVPIFVRPQKGEQALTELLRRGAEVWPDDTNVAQLACNTIQESTLARYPKRDTTRPEPLFDHAVRMLTCLEGERSRSELESFLDVTPGQMRAWLPRFVDAGVLKQSSKRPVRYRAASPALPL